MFDGAAVYTAGEAIDLLDEQQSSQTQSDPHKSFLMLLPLRIIQIHEKK